MPDQIQEHLIEPAAQTLFQIPNPILILLIVVMLSVILGSLWAAYRIYKDFIQMMATHKLELKEKDEQISEAYATIYADSKTSLEFMLTLENKFSEWIKTSHESNSDLKTLLVMMSTFKAQMDYFLKKD